MIPRLLMLRFDCVVFGITHPAFAQEIETETARTMRQGFRCRRTGPRRRYRSSSKAASLIVAAVLAGLVIYAIAPSGRPRDRGHGRSSLVLAQEIQIKHTGRQWEGLQRCTRLVAEVRIIQHQ